MTDYEQFEVPDGADDREQSKITPEMIEAGLTWLYAFSADYPERGPGIVREIMKVALGRN